MKRIGNLYSKIISIENLQLADNNARKGKIKSYGVRRHDRNRDKNILNLHCVLKNKTLRNSKYDTFKIYEPKERTIFRLPYYPDRIVHHAIMNVLEPIWMRVFTRDTYSCIKNRGIHAAARSLKEALKRDALGTKYCLKMDIRKFYPSIDHDILKSIVRRKVKDKELLWLLDEIIDSAGGVPIGNYLSQYFANLYLAYFDHWLKEEKGAKYYWRYADDMVILSDSKEYLHSLFGNINEYLNKNLKLVIKDNYQIFPTDSRGIDFLGYVFYHNHTKIRKSIKKNMFRKINRLNKRKIKPPKDEYVRSLASWYGWCKHCDSKTLLNKLFKSINYDIRFN